MPSLFLLFLSWNRETGEINTGSCEVSSAVRVSDWSITKGGNYSGEGRTQRGVITLPHQCLNKGCPCL